MRWNKCGAYPGAQCIYIKLLSRDILVMFFLLQNQNYIIYPGAQCIYISNSNSTPRFSQISSLPTPPEIFRSCFSSSKSVNYIIFGMFKLPPSKLHLFNLNLQRDSRIVRLDGTNPSAHINNALKSNGTIISNQLPSNSSQIAGFAG